MGTSSPFPKKGAAPQFSAHVYCGQTAGWIKVPLGMEVGLGPGYIVLDGDPAPPNKGGTAPPIFGPCLLWPNGWMDQGVTWYGGRPQPKRHCVRWGPAPPSQKGVRAPIFGPCLLWPNCWMDQGATWYGGRPQTRIVLDGDSAPPPQTKGAQPTPQFSAHVCCVWPNGWMDQHATWYGGRPRPRPHWGRWGPSSPSKKGGTAPNFWPMSIVAKWLDGS